MQLPPAHTPPGRCWVLGSSTEWFCLIESISSTTDSLGMCPDPEPNLPLRCSHSPHHLSRSFPRPPSHQMHCHPPAARTAAPPAPAKCLHEWCSVRPD